MCDTVRRSKGAGQAPPPWTTVNLGGCFEEPPELNFLWKVNSKAMEFA